MPGVQADPFRPELAGLLRRGLLGRLPGGLLLGDLSEGFGEEGPQILFARRIGVSTATLLVVASMVGTGVFTTGGFLGRFWQTNAQSLNNEGTFNVNGAISARAVVSQRVPEGMVMMYHAQEKIVNVPGSETTKTRGIHNSVTRAITKPTHMIGGYAQLSYGFNYYGTIGTNRDEFVLVRKMANVAWLDGPRVTPQAADLKAAE